MKQPKVTKKSNPHRKKFGLPATKGKQTRKGGKGTALMHFAARKQSEKEAAASNQSPSYPSSQTRNRADMELKKLQGNSD